ncbi:aminotransferase class V-fold PLP-dependent enzyme [Kutzneria sp. NPDC052558]|uniref:aminotransferase class V-fold PLP-dependent enzyme n=1 Tax=Kutzneria sp. NPDC052558 TaxID=3364121 RepID=UPI0037CCBC32
MGLPHDSVRTAWTGLRSETPLLHLDSAACGRTTVATRAAIAEHLEREAELGGYIAEGEADGAVTEARRQLGRLLGGFGPDEVALLESASTAGAQLLAAWPVEPGDEVWIAPSEWGPNIQAFRDRGLDPVLLKVDDSGLIDLDALRARLITRRPAMVHLTGLTAHRALVQPAREIIEIAGDVPVVIDTAQALGHIEIPDGAAAVYGTSRKWLSGPRGVGYLAVREPWPERLVPRAPALNSGVQPVRSLESREAYVAGRVGLATTLREYVGIGPELIRERLWAIGRELRAGLADLPGWSLRDPVDAPGAIVALVPDDERDLVRLRADLVDRKMLTTVSGRERAPLDITRPMLRLSPHVDFELAWIPQIRALLTT